MTQKAFIEVQFPIGPISLESYKERKANHAQILKTLGKWWGEKPMVLTRAIIIANGRVIVDETPAKLHERNKSGKLDDVFHDLTT